jgi:hypothetical protein
MALFQWQKDEMTRFYLESVDNPNKDVHRFSHFHSQPLTTHHKEIRQGVPKFLGF